MLLPLPTLASPQDPFVPASGIPAFLALLAVLLIATIAALVWQKRLLRNRAGRGKRLLVALLTLAAAVVLLVTFTDQLNNFFYRRLYDRANYPPEPPPLRYTEGNEPGDVLHFYEETGASSIYGYWRDAGLVATLTVSTAAPDPPGVFRKYDRLKLTTENTYNWDSTMRAPAGESSLYVPVHWQATVELPNDADLAGHLATLTINGSIRYPRADDKYHFSDATSDVRFTQGVAFVDAQTQKDRRALDAQHKADTDTYDTAYLAAGAKFEHHLTRVRAATWGAALLLLLCAAGLVFSTQPAVPPADSRPTENV